MRNAKAPYATDRSLLIVNDCWGRRALTKFIAISRVFIDVGFVWTESLRHTTIVV